MIEPSVAMQTAIRAALVANPAVTALVQPDRIRAGSTRPDRFPSIILAGASTEYLGRASGDQHVARVYLDAHIWAIEDGADTAKAIAHHLARAVITMSDHQDDFDIDEMQWPRAVYMRDPAPELAYTHGVIEIEAVIRWRA